MRNLSLVLLFIITLLFFVTKTTPQKNIELIGSPSQNNDENNKSQKINSMSCSDVAISIRGRLPITVHGSIFLEGKKFRMITFSLLGKEFDIGVNDKTLWYWSKRSKPKVMYFSKIENLEKTKLKTALNPEWIVMSLMLDNDTKKPDEIIEHQSGIILLNKHINHMEENMTVATLLDRDTKLAKGRYLYNGSDKMVASSEITSRQMIEGISVPRGFVITWYDEGIIMDWTLINATINTKINEKSWIMPNINPAIDIGK